MNVLAIIPYTVGFVSGFFAGLSVVTMRRFKQEQEWEQNCREYLRDEGGYEAVEAGIDEYLDQLIRTAGA
jgi:hypothetical protein